MPGKATLNIDRTNQSLWDLRYSDPVKVVSKSTSQLKKAQKAGYKKGIAYSKLTLAAAFFLQSKNDHALENLFEALKWFSEHPGEHGHAKALCLKGNIHESFGDYEKALEYCLNSRKLASDISDRETEAEAVSQLGLIYTRLCNFPKALVYYETGLKIREEMKDENAVASSLNRIGMLMRLTKKHEASLDYYFRSLNIRRKNNQDTSIPWTLLGIASTYEDLGKTDEALDYYRQGLTGGDRRCALQCMMGCGRIYSIRGENYKAGEKLEESLRIAGDLKAQSLVAEAYSALAKHYESTGETEKALRSYKLFQKTRESVQNEEVQIRFRNIEISHAIEKSEQEKEIYRLRHVELKEAYNIIDEINKDITASINYARRIQLAMLPRTQEIRGLTGRCFILNLPKDIVSGDFYWFARVDKKLVIVAGDCTGHGVPGALMSMLGISFLEEIVRSRSITESGEILDELRKGVKHALHQKGKEDEARDGMDICLCVIDPEKNMIQYSGAYNNLYHIRNGQLSEFPADRMPIGIYSQGDKNFKSQNIPSQPGDIIYLHSDGFADQFGGPDRKKYKSGPFKAFLLKICNLPLNEQKDSLEKEFNKWKGSGPQIDDVTVVGLRI
jgi:serine phosphatase RsbU (regulator of sigma subunit)